MIAGPSLATVRISPSQTASNGSINAHSLMLVHSSVLILRQSLRVHASGTMNTKDASSHGFLKNV